jgi:nucleoside-diphosphate-sugar epimerase
VDGTSNVLHAAAEKGCSRIVFGSSYHVYMASPPTSIVDEDSELPEQDLDAFGTSKLVTEHLTRAFCRQAGIDLVTLRFGSVYGLGSCTNLMGDLFKACSNEEEVEIWGTGKRTNHYVDLNDLARGCVLALAAAPGLYNVLDPRRYTIRDVCEIAEEVLGVQTTYRMDIKERPSFATIRADRFMKETQWQPTELADSFRRILPQIVAQRAA